MSFTLLTQLEEILLNYIVTSPSSYTELKTLVSDLYLDYRQVSEGRLSTTLTNMIEKDLINKDKHIHIDSNGKKCHSRYSPTQLGNKLLQDYRNLHNSLQYSLTQYSRIKLKHNFTQPR